MLIPPVAPSVVARVAPAAARPHLPSVSAPAGDFFQASVRVESAPRCIAHAPVVASVGDVHPGGRVGVHGMVVFGGADSGLYMSHIPMFHPPHDMQATFRVSLDPPTSQGFRDGLYTFQPERFSLDDLLLGNLTTMKGTLYRGSFEGDGIPLHDVSVKVERVLGYHTLTADSPAVPDLEYQVMGTSRDAYLFHPIAQAPDFDHIVRLDLSHSTLTAKDIADGVRLVIAGRRNNVDDRLRTGAVQATVQGTDRVVQIGVARTLSILVGPDFTDGPPSP